MKKLVLALTAITFVLAGTLWLTRLPVPAPPSIEAMGPMDPEVASLLRELQQSVEAAPADVLAWGRFGMACEANGQLGCARQAYGAAVGLAPNEARWWYALALVQSRLGNATAADEALTRTLDLAPSYAPAWSRRALWLLDRGEAAAAEAAFQRAAALDPDGASPMIGLARVQLERGEPERAVATLERVLDRQPGDRYALQLLGTAYRRIGRTDDAAFALAVGAAGEPSWPDPWSAEVASYRRGFAAMLKAATREALAGRFDAAIPLLESLRQQKPDDRALANQLGEVLVAAGRHQDAVRLLTPLVERSDANAQTHLALASAYLAAGELTRAEAEAARARALGAVGSRASEIGALIAWRAGRETEALQLLEDAAARDPRSARTFDSIGMIRLQRGQPRAALMAFGDALRRDPMHAEALAGLAMANAALGAHDQAGLALARAEQVAPDHPRVREARQRLAAR
jgi:tetratricopeptide (TPR) repeat protein